MISARPYNFLGLNSLTEVPGRGDGIGAGTGFPSGERTSIVRGSVMGRAVPNTAGVRVRRLRRTDVLWGRVWLVFWVFFCGRKWMGESWKGERVTYSFMAAVFGRFGLWL